jgi:hypothetical protein
MYVGEYYKIEVIARNNNGESDPSAAYENVFANLPSVVPDLVVESKSDSSIKLNWSDARDNGSPINQYFVEWE